MSLTNQCRSVIINTVTKEESRREAKTEQDITLPELEFNVVEICIAILTDGIPKQNMRTRGEFQQTIQFSCPF